MELKVEALCEGIPQVLRHYLSPPLFLSFYCPNNFSFRCFHLVENLPSEKYLREKHRTLIFL